MAATKRNHYYRHPKTTQERKQSQDRNDQLIRAKRRSKNLPNAYDDYRRHSEKGWKYLGRKTQYRPAGTNYSWHVFTCVSWFRISFLRSEMIDHFVLENIRKHCNAQGWYNYTKHEDGKFLLYWYGKDITNK